MTCAAGCVYLVGAGPGDPDLITVRGLRLIRLADVIVHDRLAPAELLTEARSGIEIIDVGKEPGRNRFAQDWISALLVDRAKKGLHVVRLKGGDPFVFGRGFEELDACRIAGVACAVVPGVSSALAAPEAAGISVTRRGLARSVAIITGQLGRGEPGGAHDFSALARMDTVVILMGRANLAELTQSLIAAGLDANTPAACIERATTSKQRVVLATLETIAQRTDNDGLHAPVVTVIGEVAGDAIETSSGDLWPMLDRYAPIPKAV